MVTRYAPPAGRRPARGTATRADRLIAALANAGPSRYPALAALIGVDPGAIADILTDCELRGPVLWESDTGLVGLVGQEPPDFDETGR